MELIGEAGGKPGSCDLICQQEVKPGGDGESCRAEYHRWTGLDLGGWRGEGGTKGGGDCRAGGEA